MGSKAGQEKCVAVKLGISVDALRANRTAGLSWCGKCREWYPLADFNKDKSRFDGVANWCKTCFNIQTSAQTYGISFQAAKTLRNSACEICFSTKRLCIDHDHETGRVRGVLCHSCNVGIGNFKECERLLAAAATYLKKPPVEIDGYKPMPNHKASWTQCPKGHPFDNKNTGRTKAGRRFCLECRRFRDRNRRDAGFWRSYRRKRNGKQD